MDKVYTRINWENYPSTKTAVNEVNLNKIDSAVNTIDDRVVSLDVSKAEKSGLLESVKDITYDETSGVFVFTWHNGTELIVDLNIEKIPVSFSMSADGIITMVTTDGETYTADIGSLITNYSFEDSSVIAFSSRTASDGTKIITANIPDGSITGQKLQPNYLADITTQAANALRSETNANTSAIKAKGSEDRAKQYADQAAATDVGQLIPRVAALETDKADQSEVTAIKESLIQFKNDGFLPKNLFDGTVNKGLWIVNNVVTSNASGQYVIVPCEGGKTYTVSKKNLGLLWIASTVEYPAPNVNILDVQRGGSSNTKVATITTSSNAKYLLVEFGAGGTIEPSTYEELMIEEGTEATQYVTYAISNTDLTQIVDDAIDGEYIQNKNKLNLIGHGLISQTDGKTISSNSTISYSDYIKLDDTKKWVLSSDVSGVSCRYFEYDANKNYLRNSTGASATSSSDAHYIRIQVGDTYLVNAMLEVGTTTKTSYVPYVPSNTELKQSLNQLSTVQSGAVTNLSAIASTYRMRLKKCGNIVTINFYFGLNAISDNLTQWYPLFQLPSGFFNTDNHIDFILNDFDKNSYQAMVSSTGQMQFVPRASVTQGRLCVINLTYILG